MFAVGWSGGFCQAWHGMLHPPHVESQKLERDGLDARGKVGKQASYKLDACLPDNHHYTIIHGS